MIPRTIPTLQGQNWQDELSRLITDPEDLINRLELNALVSDKLRLAAKQFPLRATESFVSRMRPGDLSDPLLLQVLPLEEELLTQTSWSEDPLKEQKFMREQGLIHKYKGRVLLIVSPQCAINCRYCFRRHFDYNGNTPGRREWAPAFTYIENDTSIEEAIFSGGDPLAISDRQLDWLVYQLENIPHIKRLRIHTRMPIVLPSRLTQTLVDRLVASRLRCVFVIHTNHPREIDEQVQTSLKSLRKARIDIFNQTVLLKNVNNSVNTLSSLSNKLFDCGVLPYYLHRLDKVMGARHFDIPRSQAISLYEGLRAELPGYLVPQLVEEIPGANSKSLVV